MSYFKKNSEWEFPIPIKYGPERIKELGEICYNLKIINPLIVTDNGSKNLYFIELVFKSLREKNIRGRIFYDISPNPKDFEIRNGKIQFNKYNHDAVIAIGGGSGMDAAKGISLISRNDFDLWEFDYENKRELQLFSKDFVPLICIPTTAGTGAETESTAMITNTELEIKTCIWHRNHKPLLAILDPFLTVNLPKKLTAWTGCDALVHAIEAFTVPSFHPLCDSIALEAIRLIYKWLPKVYSNGDNIDARGAMLVGSCLAGISFTKGLGLVHAISHMIGAINDNHHGLTNAILLPLILEFNRESYGNKINLMCNSIGIKNKNYDNFYKSIVYLLEKIDIPNRLTLSKYDTKYIEDIARKSFMDPARRTNPTPSKIEDIFNIINKAIVKTR